MNNRPKYSCIVDTTYTLSLYLLFASEEQIKQTAFFVGNAIPDSVSRFLPSVIRINNARERYYKANKLLRRIEAVFKWRFRYHTFIYAQDHLAFSANLIGSKQYFLLEDAPNIYTLYRTIKFMIPNPPQTIFHAIKDYILLGPIGARFLGTNNQCVDRLVTSPEDIESELLRNTKYTLIDMKDLWDKSPSSKCQYILKVFNIEPDMFDASRKCETVLFSQPLIEDCKLTEQEMIEIYNPYIKKYEDKGIVIKPHPRDRFDYKKWFPQTLVIDCKAPMQLLSAMGMDFKTAITVCSSAVSSMSDGTKIIWIGSSVNEKVYKVYGDLKCPKPL